MQKIVLFVTIFLLGTTLQASELSARLDKVIHQSQSELLQLQKENTYWDMPSYVGSQYVSFALLFEKWLQLPIVRTSAINQEEFAGKLISEQLPNGGWETTHDGLLGHKGNLDATILHYFALKVIGHDIDEEYMTRARRYILARGGIEKATLLSKIILALFNNYNWNEIPSVPWILFSEYNPLNYTKFAQWIAPHLMPIAYLRNHEVFKQLGPRYNLRELHNHAFVSQNKMSRPGIMAGRLIKKIMSRQSRQGTWQGYAGATMLTLMALDFHHGQGPGGVSNVSLQRAYNQLHRTLFRGDVNDLNGIIYDGRFWDTALISTALIKSGLDSSVLENAKNFLLANQVNNGGFPFGIDFWEDPDCDQTSESVIALLKLKAPMDRIHKTVKWLLSMQNKDGGWGAFDRDNNENFILGYFVSAFRDSADLFDESSADVTAHVLESLADFGLNIKNSASVRKGVYWLRKNQDREGLWMGRWGINYNYGTTQAVAALIKVGIPANDPMITRALGRLLRSQNSDGGFGESPYSYHDKKYALRGVSTVTQTAWSVIALAEGGLAHHPATRKAVEFLLRSYESKGSFVDVSVVGTGHPGVIMIQYPSYAHAFALMALSNYRELTQP